jgi:hypothetical protein
VAVEAIGVLAEVAIAVVSFVADVLATLFRPALRSLRYSFSSAYRHDMKAELDGRSILYRVAYLAWGYLAALLWLVVLGLVAYWIVSATISDRPCDRLDLDHAAKCVREIRDALSN